MAISLSDYLLSSKPEEKKKGLTDVLSKDVPASPAVPKPEEPIQKAEQVMPGQPQVTKTTETISGYVPTVDAALDRKQMQAFINEYERKARPFDAARVGRDIDSMVRAYAPGSPADMQAVAPYAQSIKDAVSEMEQIRKDKAAQLDRTEWNQLAENIGHALTQLGAGMYGAKHGVDMSGLKFNKVDWQKQLENRMGLLDDQLMEARLKRKEATEGMGQARKDLKEQAEKKASLMIKGEQEASDNARDIAKTQLNASIDVYKSQMAQANQAARYARTIEKQLMEAEQKGQEIDRSQAQAALRALDKEYKLGTDKMAGLDEAISVIQAQKDGTMKEAVATAKLNSALKRAGLDVTELPQVEFSLFSPSTWGSSAQQDAGMQMLKGLKDKLSQSFSEVDAAHKLAYEKVTGQKRPGSAREGSGETTQAPVQTVQPSGKVRVAKDGQEFDLPAEQLKEALSQGYTQVK